MGISVREDTVCSISENDHRILSYTFRNVKLEVHSAQ